MKPFDALKAAAAALLFMHAAGANAADVKLRMAGQHPADHNATRVQEDVIARIEAANVGVGIKLFPAGQLGNGEVVFDDVTHGVIDIGHTFVYSHNDPVLEINSLPYLVGTYEEMEEVYSPGSQFYRIFEERLNKLGLHLLGVFAEGFVGVGTNAKPDNPGTPGDKGLDIRVWSAEVGRLTAQAMGFRTTTMNWGDVPGAMQQGVVDGWIGGTAELNYTAFAGIVRYFTPYKAFVENTTFYINKRTWDGLSAEQRKVMSAAFAEASAQSFALSRSVDADYLKRLPGRRHRGGSGVERGARRARPARARQRLAGARTEAGQGSAGPDQVGPVSRIRTNPTAAAPDRQKALRAASFSGCCQGRLRQRNRGAPA